VLEQQVPDRHHGAEPEGARGEQQVLHAGIDRRCLGDGVEPWAATEEAQCVQRGLGAVGGTASDALSCNDHERRPVDQEQGHYEACNNGYRKCEQKRQPKQLQDDADDEPDTDPDVFESPSYPLDARRLPRSEPSRCPPVELARMSKARLRSRWSP
jgi:hypothetical protein